jgi:glutamine synthetase adenylyltransferase
MQAIKSVRKLIQAEPDSQRSKVLAALVLALESEEPFNLARLYELGYEDFEQALKLIQEWRLDRYYSAKYRLLDISMQAERVGTAAN